MANLRRVLLTVPRILNSSNPRSVFSTSIPQNAPYRLEIELDVVLTFGSLFLFGWLGQLLGLFRVSIPQTTQLILIFPMKKARGVYSTGFLLFLYRVCFSSRFFPFFCVSICNALVGNCRLLYRSKQRGFLELDLVLGKWVQDHIHSMDENGVKSLVHVLDLVS